MNAMHVLGSEVEHEESFEDGNVVMQEVGEAHSEFLAVFNR